MSRLRQLGAFDWLRIGLAGALLVVAGCSFGALAPVVGLDERPTAIDDRPGGRGVADSVRYVIHVSVDGLRPDAVERLGANLPAFARLRTESAWTHNARTDFDYSITLPNHTAQFTGRPVVGARGHGWTENVDPASGVTLHTNKGEYVASVFDVAHDAGLATAAYVSKSKFSLFNVSYDETNGAPDTTGEDDGRDKIDRFVYDADTEDLVAELVADLGDDPAAYTFLHIRDPDATGHVWAWNVSSGSRYMRAVRRSDARIRAILEAIESDDRLVGRTALIVTADHGGSSRHHRADRPLHYTIPFYAWGPGIELADLYAINPEREDPGGERPGFATDRQPVRNGDAANLALALLGLDPVPGSTIGIDAPLRVAETGSTRQLDAAAEARDPTSDL